MIAIEGIRKMRPCPNLFVEHLLSKDIKHISAQELSNEILICFQNHFIFFPHFRYTLKQQWFQKKGTERILLCLMLTLQAQNIK